MYSPPPVWIFEPNSFTSADHPHVCGENLPACWIWYTQFGPSPRVWGERRCSCDCTTLTRTIPTCVGRTPQLLANGNLYADHPHVCGENQRCCRKPGHVHGPSPRVWGEPKVSGEHVNGTRTIPTCVGRTIW